MTNLERVLSGNFDNVKNYGDNLDELKLRMQNEVKHIDNVTKKNIDNMNFEELLVALNKKNNIVFKVFMMADSSRKYAFGCMEVFEKMDTVDEKYTACRFFHCVDKSQKNSKLGNMMADVFFTRHDLGNV